MSQSRLVRADSASENQLDELIRMVETTLNPFSSNQVPRVVERLQDLLDVTTRLRSEGLAPPTGSGTEVGNKLTEDLNVFVARVQAIASFLEKF